MSSCFGSRRKSQSDRDTEPLLPRYEDDTSMQRRLHQKLHSYQMWRALSKGYMPSTEQVIVNLRTLLASDVLNADNPALSDSGRLLIKYTRQWITEFIELLRHKNDRDQIQEFIWCLSKSRVSVDANDLIRTASTSRTRADVSAAYESFKVIGSLLLTNSDFRLFLSDLNTIGRQVFADAALTASDVAREAAEQIEPTEQDKQAAKHPESESGPAPTVDDLAGEASQVTSVVANGVARTGAETASSLQDQLSGQQKDALLFRLKNVITNLRRRRDYSDSVSVIGQLLQRYAKIYSRAVDNTVGTVQDDVELNAELDRAVKDLWSFVTSFGDPEEWKELEKRFNQLTTHSQKDPEFEDLMNDAGNTVQKLLTDPNFLDTAQEKVQDLREKSKEVGTESSLRQDINSFLSQVQKTFQSVLNDEDVSKLMSTSMKIYSIVFPQDTAVNPGLVEDALQVFVPLLIHAIQYIPIPRLEVSVPEIDLLLENLVLEPGKTVNNSSFLPFRLRIETYNDLEIRKAKFKTASKVTSLVTIKIDGMSIRADDVGFWLRAHSGLLRLADEGIASFQLDERGTDLQIEVEVGKNKLEKILTLRNVKVKIHKLSYTLRKSKFACLAWVFKPFLRPILRKVLERQIATAIADGLHAANRELVYARERLRATRISDPNDIRAFFKAIMTRLTPEEDPDMYVHLGVSAPGKGIFAGVYAPGSMVKLWNEEAARAGEIMDDNAEGGWRNDIFDVPALMTT